MPWTEDEFIDYGRISGMDPSANWLLGPGAEDFLAVGPDEPIPFLLELKSEQAIRLFDTHLAPGRSPSTDAEGRIRLDDLEMAPEVQAEVMHLWNRVDDALLAETGAFERFQRYFRELFGFDVPGLDYDRPVEVELPLT